MKIGVLTFLRVANFGANLQATSTYYYLKNQGHDVVFVDYSSWQTDTTAAIAGIKRKLLHKPLPIQTQEHYHFLDEHIKERTVHIRSGKQLRNVIQEIGIEGIIIGSDAVAQHWPLFSTLKLGKHRPFWIEPLQQERRFPNPFWGIGFANKVPVAMMSVSSQNSKYRLFCPLTLKRMKRPLDLMTYVSARDAWTKEMMLATSTRQTIEITPDPVFALNQNLGDRIATETEIRRKFDLPQNYVLIGLRSQVFSWDELQKLNELFKKQGKECVAFNIDGRYNYKHPFAYTIPLPLSPLDWFGLIKYASAYIGSNMHPIVSSLTNGVPCFSLDNWGTVDFWGKKKNAGSSKVYDVLGQYGLKEYWCQIENGRCTVNIKDIVQKIMNFPVKDVKRISDIRYQKYAAMMNSIIESFKK